MQTQTMTRLNVSGLVSTTKINPINGLLVVNMVNGISLFNAISLVSTGWISTGQTYNDMEFLPNGNVILGGSTLDIYSLPSGNITFSSSLSSGQQISRILTLPDNVTIVLGDTNGSLVLFNSNTNIFGTKFSSNMSNVQTLLLTPDLIYIISGGENNQIILWNWITMNLTFVTQFTTFGPVFSALIPPANFTSS
jgi:WD40 repeat protein